MHSTQPLVSVVIPSFNAGATLSRALESVRRQSYGPLQIIVVDDASTDDTPTILSREEARGVKVIRLARNAGAAAARNAGVAAAQGELIAFLDADDEWLPEKLARQVPIIDRFPEMTFIASRAGLVRTDGMIQASLHGELESGAGFDAWRVLLAYTFVATPTVVARRAAIQAVGGFDPNLVVGEDQDLWIRLALRGEVGFIEDVLVIVHEQVDSLTRRHVLRELEVTMPIIERHIAALRDRLTDDDIRRILGYRYTQLGRNAYHHLPLRGIQLILKAMRLRHRPFENLTYILNAAPPSRWLKWHLLGRRIS
jgi:glycosyltransferase involved in cell wall biosynthesis